MCLILFAWQSHPDYPLIVAANRDEFYQRPTQASHCWTESNPVILAGKDLQAGGTWMGITDNGRFAAVTNYREVPAAESALSRGQLVTDYLQDSRPAAEYATNILDSIDHYAGFNLLIGDKQNLMHISNRGTAINRIAPGVHGLSNASLNTDWPKVSKGRQRVSELLGNSIRHYDLLKILGDQEPANPDQLPDTGVSTELEKALSPIRIQLPEYGTRSSTTVLIGHNATASWMETSYSSTSAENTTVFFTKDEKNTFSKKPA